MKIPTWIRRVKLRLLPAVIFVAVVAMGLRTGDILYQITHPDMASLSGINGALAASEEDKHAQEDHAADETAQNTQIPPPPAPDPVSDPIVAEMAERLAARKKRLDEMEAKLVEREAMLQAWEAKIDEKTAELKELRQELENFYNKISETQESEIKSLVSIYEKMKPKQAAEIMKDLEQTVLLEIFTRMKESKAAPILAAMPPAKAKMVTEMLSEAKRF